MSARCSTTLLAASLMVVACGSQGGNTKPTAAGAAQAPVATQPQSVSPTTRPTPPPLVIPTPQTVFRRCLVGQLEARLISIGAATGNVGAVVELRNRSGVECELSGYAGVQLLDSAGGPLPTKVQWTSKSFFGPDTPVSVVALPPDTVQITPGQPVAGHADFDMSWDDVLPPCVVASQLLVTPPDSYQSLTISATPPGGFSGQMTVCSGGTLDVQPVRPAR